MSIDRLIQEGSVHSFQATAEEIGKVLQISRRDMETALRIRGEDPDWSYNIAYNAVLQACKAFLFFKGYRASASETHKATLAFMLETVDEPWHTKIEYFDRVRKKRHRLVYDEIGLISQTELTNLLNEARAFIDFIKEVVTDK
jgi:uncharacterized protein (UPF0332 family)